MNMKAFLSHSSKDKHIVDQVAQQLGAGSSNYDRETFEEGKRSADEILRSLSDSDLFVLFLSRHSLGSPWVTEEAKLALHEVFSGRLKGVLVFALDESSYTALPYWLRQYTIERNDKPAQIVRRIRSRLIEIQLVEGKEFEIFVGREKELRDTQRALTLPPEEMHPTIAIAGWPGLGRRSLISRAFQATYPYLKRIQPTVLLADNDSIEDFYQKLFDATDGVARTSSGWQVATKSFQESAHNVRINIILAMIGSIVKAKEVLFIIGDNGLVRQNGEFQSYIDDILERLPKTPRPQVVLVHRRRLSATKQNRYQNKVFFVAINSFNDEETTELLSAHLKRHDIGFTRADLEDLVRFVGGHPESVKLAAKYAQQYGLDQLRREKSEFIDMLVLQSLETVKSIRMSLVAKTICMALIDYQYLQIDDLVTATAALAADSEISEQIRTLEDHGILERVGRYYRISPFLVEALSRSEFAREHSKERRQIGERMLTVLSGISEFDYVSLSLINAATLTMIRNKKNIDIPVLVTALLPSHLLTIAREEYNNRDYRSSAQLCSRALESQSRLTEDAQIEAHRLFAISSLRLGERANFEGALRKLQQFQSRTAKRNYHFLLGLRSRYDGLIDEAERHFIKAYKLDNRNFHILRELSHLLNGQGRYSEAERYARAAYSIAPTNAFVIDVLCEVIIGRETPEDIRDNGELRKLLAELQALGTAQDKSFYNGRIATMYYKVGELQTAWKHANQAVQQSPRALGPRLLRVRLAHRLGWREYIEGDMRELSESSTTEGYGNRFLVDRLHISNLIANKELIQAVERLKIARSLPDHVRQELEMDLRREIQSSGNVDPLLIEWSKRGNRTSPKRPRLRANRNILGHGPQRPR